MNAVRRNLMIDAVGIVMKRQKITLEAALAKYPALTEEDRAAISAAFK